MLETILVLIVLIVGLVVFIALLTPDEFRISRSKILNAPSQSIFEQVNDLEKWQTWSPWAEMDPNAKVEFQGPKAGEGAIFRWVGEKTGSGEMTILESRPDFIRFKLEFYKPFKGVNTAEFSFVPADYGTNVIWTMYGPHTFLSKFIHRFMNCDKMVGTQFEKGLENLRRIVEK